MDFATYNTFDLKDSVSYLKRTLGDQLETFNNKKVFLQYRSVYKNEKTINTIKSIHTALNKNC